MRIIISPAKKMNVDTDRPAPTGIAGVFIKDKDTFCRSCKTRIFRN